LAHFLLNWQECLIFLFLSFSFFILEIQRARKRVGARSNKVPEFWSGKHRNFMKQQEENCDDKLLNFAQNSCQSVACKLEFTPLSFGKAILIPIQVQVLSKHFVLKSKKKDEEPPLGVESCQRLRVAAAANGKPSWAELAPLPRSTPAFLFLPTSFLLPSPSFFPYLPPSMLCPPLARPLAPSPTWGGSQLPPPGLPQ
jgi:hypothetical protein